jgi:hypothetical protein
MVWVRDHMKGPNWLALWALVAMIQLGAALAITVGWWQAADLSVLLLLVLSTVQLSLNTFVLLMMIMTYRRASV